MMRSLPLLALLAAAASAQPSNWLPLPTDGTVVSVRALRPSFDSPDLGSAPIPDDVIVDPDDYYGGRTSVWAVEAAVPVGAGLRVVGEVPFALVSISDELYDSTIEVFPDYEQTGAALGNIRLGVERALPGLTVGADVRVPTAANHLNSVNGNAAGLGFISTIEQIGAFTPELVTVSAHAAGERALSDVVSVRAQAAPILAVRTDDVSDGRTRLFASYGAQLLVAGGPARVGVGLSGVSRVAGTDNSAIERHEVSAGALADVQLGAFRPGVQVRVPVAGFFDDVLDAVVGLAVTYSIR